VKLRVVDAWQTVADTGYRRQMPIVHLAGRDTDWQRHHVEIEGFRPYFLVTVDEWVERG